MDTKIMYGNGWGSAPKIWHKNPKPYVLKHREEQDIWVPIKDRSSSPSNGGCYCTKTGIHLDSESEVITILFDSEDLVKEITKFIKQNEEDFVFYSSLNTICRKLKSFVDSKTGIYTKEKKNKKQIVIDNLKKFCKDTNIVILSDFKFNQVIHSKLDDVTLEKMIDIANGK